MKTYQKLVLGGVALVGGALFVKYILRRSEPQPVRRVYPVGEQTLTLQEVAKINYGMAATRIPQPAQTRSEVVEYQEPTSTDPGPLGEQFWYKNAGMC